MPFAFGKKDTDHKNDVFVPTDLEREFLAPFLESRQVPFLEVKKQILVREDIPQERREKLGEWFRDARAETPVSGAERKIDF